MAKCLVLGANGFIGSHLVDSLVEKGHTVRAFGRFGDRDKRFNGSSQVELVDGNFLNREDLRQALRDIEYVFHFISTTTPITAENDPIIDITTNITTSVELFQDCVTAGVKRVIFASTGGAMYGAYDSNTPLSETVTPLPVSPYAIGKLTIENYLRYFKVKHGLDFMAVRISNPYGERQSIGRKQGVIPIFLEKIHDGEPLTVIGDGSMVRDYVYVKDVTNIIGTIFDQPHPHDIYNVGTGRGESVNNLLQAMKTLTGKEIVTKTVPAPSTFVQNVVLDTTRLKEDFNVTPTTSLEDGLRKTWDYICAYHGSEETHE